MGGGIGPKISRVGRHLSYRKKDLSFRWFLISVNASLSSIWIDLGLKSTDYMLIKGSCLSQKMKKKNASFYRTMIDLAIRTCGRFVGMVLLVERFVVSFISVNVRLSSIWIDVGFSKGFWLMCNFDYGVLLLCQKRGKNAYF